MDRRKASLKLKLICFPFFILPRPLKKAVAFFWTTIWFLVIRFRVEETRERVRRALPDKTEKEVNYIAFYSLYNLILTFFELSYRAFGKKHIYKYTKVKNIEYLKESIKGDRPVFLFTGHLANGEVILSRVCYEGVPLHLIAKRVRNAFLDAIVFEAREVSGLVHIPPKNALSEIMGCIKKKAPLVFLHDQYMRPPKGVETTFMGLPVFTNPSVAKFALKNNAMVIPVNLYRENSNTVVEFEPEIPLEKKFPDFEDNVVHMTQIFNDWLTDKVTKRPDEWMWIHRRFKNPLKK